MALTFNDLAVPRPPADFWAIVALDVPNASGDRNAWYIQKSPDAVERDLLVECSTDADGDDMRWAKDLPAGVYRIAMNPQGGEDWFDLNITKAECLWELPA